MKVLSKERKVGSCNCCGNQVRELAFVKLGKGNFSFYCYECAGLQEESRILDWELEIIEIDEERLAREEVMDILLNLAEEDEGIFRDPRLTVIKSFKEEIVEGIINENLERYIRFNGNDIGEVLKLRNYAIEGQKRNGSVYKEIVDLYKDSRIKKLNSHQTNRIKILLCNKDIQNLNPDFKTVWENLSLIRVEVIRESSSKRYDNIDEIRDIISFVDEKEYATEQQMKKLKSFYYEMLRRNRKR